MTNLFSMYVLNLGLIGRWYYFIDIGDQGDQRDQKIHFSSTFIEKMLEYINLGRIGGLHPFANYLKENEHNFAIEHIACFSLTLPPNPFVYYHSISSVSYCTPPPLCSQSHFICPKASFCYASFRSFFSDERCDISNCYCLCR